MDFSSWPWSLQRSKISSLKMMNGIATGIQKWSSFVCLRIPHLAFRRVANSKVIPFWHYSASCPTLKICKWGQHSIGQNCCVKLRSKHLLGRCKSSNSGKWMRAEVSFFNYHSMVVKTFSSTPSIHLQRRSRNRFLISFKKAGLTLLCLFFEFF